MASSNTPRVFIGGMCHMDAAFTFFASFGLDEDVASAAGTFFASFGLDVDVACAAGTFFASFGDVASAAFELDDVASAAGLFFGLDDLAFAAGLFFGLDDVAVAAGIFPRLDGDDVGFKAASVISSGCRRSSGSTK